MVRRAGLDYWPLTDIHYHKDVDELAKILPGSRMLFLTTKSDQSYVDVSFPRLMIASSLVARQPVFRLNCLSKLAELFNHSDEPARRLEA